MAKRILVVEDGADLRAVVVAVLTQVYNRSGER